MLAKGKTTSVNNDAGQALEAALRYLARREYSKTELKAKLRLKFTAEATDSALNKCLENNWLSDERYAQMLFEHMKHQYYGPLRFVMEAKRKGIGQELYQDLMEETDWCEVAASYLRKKFVRDAPISYQQKQKILASLYRRGFSNSDCIEAVESYFSCLDGDDF